uniref:Putative secreted protein n=1 Tax=Ixodes ricinus TaxID=34613 RepID=A0A6B0TWY0_IXORI
MHRRMLIVRPGVALGVTTGCRGFSTDRYFIKKLLSSERFNGKMVAGGALGYMELYGDRNRKLAKMGPIFPLNFSKNHMAFE